VVALGSITFIVATMGINIVANFVSIGLSLLGAYALIPNVGDCGWLIGAALGALSYTALMRRRTAPALSRAGGAAA